MRRVGGGEIAQRWRWRWGRWCSHESVGTGGSNRKDLHAITHMYNARAYMQQSNLIRIQIQELIAMIQTANLSLIQIKRGRFCPERQSEPNLVHGMVSKLKIILVQGHANSVPSYLSLPLSPPLSLIKRHPQIETQLFL